MLQQPTAHHSLISASLLEAQSASSLGRDWDGVEVDWHDWKGGGNASAPPHDSDTIVMRTSGKVRLTQMRDGKTHTAMALPGNVTLHPRGMESKWSWTAAGAIAVVRLPTGLLNGAAETMLRSPPASLSLANCFGRKDAFIENIINMFVYELRSPPHPSQRYITQALSSALACHMVQRFSTQGLPVRAHAFDMHARAVQRVKDYIREHMHEPLSLDTLAAVANVSRFHFSRMFRVAAGVSAMQYLEQARMERAQELLRTGRMALAQVALLVGYDDPSYFARRFRLYVGVTPAAFVRAVRA